MKCAEDREREDGLHGGGAVRPHPTVPAVCGARTRSQLQHQRSPVPITITNIIMEKSEIASGLPERGPETQREQMPSQERHFLRDL